MVWIPTFFSAFWTVWPKQSRRTRANATSTSSTTPSGTKPADSAGIISSASSCLHTGPDYNPIERLWLRLKADYFADFIARTLDELIERLSSALNAFMDDHLLVASQCAIRK